MDTVQIELAMGKLIKELADKMAAGIITRQVSEELILRTRTTLENSSVVYRCIPKRPRTIS